MEFSSCGLIKPLEENSTPGTLKAVQVALVEPVAYLKWKVKRRFVQTHLFLCKLHFLCKAGYAQDFSMLLVCKVLSGVGAGMAFIAGVRYVTVVFAPFRVHLAQGLYGGCIQLGAGTSLYLMPLLRAVVTLLVRLVSIFTMCTCFQGKRFTISGIKAKMLMTVFEAGKEVHGRCPPQALCME